MTENWNGWLKKHDANKKEGIIRLPPISFLYSWAGPIHSKTSFKFLNTELSPKNARARSLPRYPFFFSGAECKRTGMNHKKEKWIIVSIRVGGGVGLPSTTTSYLLPFRILTVSFIRTTRNQKKKDLLYVCPNKKERKPVFDLLTKNLRNHTNYLLVFIHHPPCL